MNRLIWPLVALMALSTSGCGDDESAPTGPPTCPDFDPTVKYDKPPDAASRTLWNKCIPQDLGEAGYHPIEKPALIVKLKDSRKMMQLKFSVMTQHDFFALRRLATHDQALRAAFTERMLQVTEEETRDPTFRDKFRAELKVIANDVIRQIENYDFDIVGQVLITSYVVE